MGVRGRISKSQVRVVPTGYDVDTAPSHKFLLHESFFASQPFHYTFVACPFAGSTSDDLLEASVAVNFTDVGNVPDIILYPVRDGGAIVFPQYFTRSDGNTTVGWNSERTTIYWESLTSSSVLVRFIKARHARRSPQGAWIVLFRRGSM